MEPQEIDPRLLNSSLRQLVFFTGLDNTNAQHSSIFNAFLNKSDQRTATSAVNYKMLPSHELFHQSRKSSSIESGGRVPSPPFATTSENNGNSAIRSGVLAMVKRRWPLKYLEERPALIVIFVDLDWDHSAWLEMRIDCESKINALRQQIGQRETKLALVLIQHPKTASMDDPNANEKALELCQHCRLNSRFLFVFPCLSDEKAQIERVNRLEKAFHDIAQEFYHACFKRIRSRNVPNNDAHLLVRQQFKLAFISELREDRHSALRYYKQAYQICHELNVADIDVYEHYSVASLLNYKICELNFILNSAVEAINQFRRHHNIFFKREPPLYPSRELAAIELVWWKAQQCLLFAELFNRAVSNGLAAYPSQNPGRFLGEATTHYKRANALIRALKVKLASTSLQRQTPPLDGDPLQSFGNVSRSWRMSPPLTDLAASKMTKLPPSTAVNQQLLERGVKLFLENNVKENYSQSIQLLSSAVTQFKRYNCERFANLSLLDMAEECIAAEQYAKAIQILRRLCVEDKNVVSFYPFLSDSLVTFANAAFCSLNLNEWTWALFQLFHPQLANITKNLCIAPSSPPPEHSKCLWMESFQHFLSGEKNYFPFALVNSLNKHQLSLSIQQLNSFYHQWHQLSVQSAQPPQFHLDMLSLHYSPILFNVHFLAVYPSVKNCTQFYNEDFEFIDENIGDTLQIANAGDSLLIKVVLQNISSVPLQFERCSLVVDEILHSSGAKQSKTLSAWVTAGNSSKNSTVFLFPGQSSHIFFVYEVSLSLSLQQLNQMSSSVALTNRCQSPVADSRNVKELIVTTRQFSLSSPSGSFNWDFDHRSTINLQRSTENKWTQNERLSKNSLAVKVRPKRCKVLLKCPMLEKISELMLFVDESVELPFTLQNSEPTNGTILKNIWVVCHKICREDEEHQQYRQHSENSKQISIPPVIRRTFATPFMKAQPHQKQHLVVSEEKGATETPMLLVPVFSQEIATLLSPEQSTEFFIRLQSKSNNCVALRIQVCCTIPRTTEKESCEQSLEEPAESIHYFPIRCVQPFESKISIYCENGEKAHCLIFRQQFRLQLELNCKENVTIHSAHWKLNNAFEHSGDQPLASLIDEQMRKLKISSVKINLSELLITHSTWMTVISGEQLMTKEAEHCNGEVDQQRTHLGNVVVEWGSKHSFERIRSVLTLPTMPPILAIPITINIKLLGDQNENKERKLDGTTVASDCYFRILQPFRLRYCLRNTSGGPLAVRVLFEQSECIAIDGIGEESFLFFPNDLRVIEHRVVPILFGVVDFPKPQIRCVSSISDSTDLEFGNEDLEQLNHLIARHAYNSIPKHFLDIRQVNVCLVPCVSLPNQNEGCLSNHARKAKIMLTLGLVIYFGGISFNNM